MIPQTKSEFKDYCLRALGKDVLQINVSDQQVDDRVDEAIYMYQQWHMDAVAETYLAYKAIGSTLTFSGNTQPLLNGAPFVGQTSNARGFIIQPSNSTTAQVYHNPNNPKIKEGEVLDVSNGNLITVGTSVDAFLTITPNTAAYQIGEQIQGANSRALGTVTNVVVSGASVLVSYTLTTIATFQVGELITGQKSLATGNTTATTAKVIGFQAGDLDLGYFNVPDSIIAVRRVFPPFDSRISADILFDPQAQFNISLLSNFTSNSIIPYYIGRQYQQLLNDTFRGRPGMRFQRHQNRIYIDVKWPTTILPNQYFIVECSEVIDPQQYPDVWSDRWLQRYAIALIKRQWGMNLSKFGGIALPGGVTLNGRDMLNEANGEVEKLEDELKNTYQEPPIFFMG